MSPIYKGKQSMIRKMLWMGACLCAITAMNSAFAGTVSPEETAKQTEFKKAYGTQVTKDRIAAVDLLDGLTHPSTLTLLTTVANTDMDKDVRVAAVKKIAAVPSRTPANARMLAQMFTNARMKDPKDTTALKQGIAEAVAGSEFKYDLGAAMTDYFHRNLRYPDMQIPNNASAKAIANIREKVEAERKELTDFLEVYNKMFDTEYKNGDKSTPPNIRKWWEANMSKFALADKQLADKYAAEDKEAAKAAKEAAKDAAK